MRNYISGFVFVLSLICSGAAQAQLSLDRLGNRTDPELRKAYDTYLTMNIDARGMQKLLMVDVLGAMKAFGFEKPENAELLEMSDQQLEELARLKAHYSELIEAVYGELPGREELDFAKMSDSKELEALDAET